MEVYLQQSGERWLLAVMIVVAVLALLWEQFWPRRPESPGLAWRWLNNGLLTGISIVIVDGMYVVTTMLSAWLADSAGVGLLGRWQPGLVWEFVLVLLALELAAYWLHRLEHRVPILWRLHAVHHSDVEVDISTTYRHHPLENILMSLIGALVVLALGASLAVLLLYQTLRVSINILSHSNIRLPWFLERWLRFVLVTPDFHHLHHCRDRRFTDSNYSSSVPVFDYLFGTATRKPWAEYASMPLGLEHSRQARDSRLDQMLLLPFRSKRFRQPPAAGVDAHGT